MPATLAAFVNGVLAHSLDYDDTHLPSVLHPSASVVPAALAAAQAAGADGQALISAVAAGLEVCVRTGMAGYDQDARNSTFFDHGQHATSICGALGGAVSAAVLLGLDAVGVTNALGIAASMAAGLIEANRTGGTVKRMHCGWAAHSAVSAAQLAAEGFTGPPTVLEGRFGFYQAWLHGQFDPAAITDGLGETWLVPDIFFKPYPANHFTHTAIDAAIELRSRGLRPEDVVVAGAGGAGLTAAVTAADHGSTVLNLEPRPTFRHDGNTAMSTGMIPAAGTRWQRAAGIEDSACRPWPVRARSAAGAARRG